MTTLVIICVALGAAVLIYRREWRRIKAQHARILTSTGSVTQLSTTETLYWRQRYWQLLATVKRTDPEVYNRVVMNVLSQSLDLPTSN